MNTDHVEDTTLVERVRALRTAVEEQRRATQRKTNTSRWIGAGLVALVSFSLYNITRLTDTLDPELVVFQARTQLEQNLPEMRTALYDELSGQAPAIVADGLDTLVASLPRVREWAVAEVGDSLDQINGEFERTAITFMENAILESRAEIERESPDAPNKHELVAEAAARRFRVAIVTSFEHVQPYYASEMRRMRGYLETIMHDDVVTLSDTERRHRELIETLIQLVIRSGDVPA